MPTHDTITDSSNECGHHHQHRVPTFPGLSAHQHVRARDGPHVPINCGTRVGQADRAVEDVIDHIDTELLDVLIDLRAEAYDGHVELGL